MFWLKTKNAPSLLGSGRTKCPWFHLNSHLADTHSDPVTAGTGGAFPPHCSRAPLGQVQGALHRPAPLLCWIYWLTSPAPCCLDILSPFGREVKAIEGFSFSSFLSRRLFHPCPFYFSFGLIIPLIGPDGEQYVTAGYGNMGMQKIDRLLKDGQSYYTILIMPRHCGKREQP